MWHVLLHCLGFAASCCHSVLGLISGRSLSWRSVTSEQNVSPRPVLGHLCHYKCKDDKREIIYTSLSVTVPDWRLLLLTGSWKAPWMDVLQARTFRPPQSPCTRHSPASTRSDNLASTFNLKLKTTLQIKIVMKQHTKRASMPGIRLSDDDTQSHGVSANTNPEANQTVPHNPLLQAGYIYRERGEGGGEGSMRVWTGWRRDTPAPWRSLRQLIFSLTVIAPVKITAKIHSQAGTG